MRSLGAARAGFWVLTGGAGGAGGLDRREAPKRWVNCRWIGSSELGSQSSDARLEARRKGPTIIARQSRFAREKSCRFNTRRSAASRKILKIMGAQGEAEARIFWNISHPGPPRCPGMFCGARAHRQASSVGGDGTRYTLSRAPVEPFGGTFCPAVTNFAPRWGFWGVTFSICGFVK
jgi:hypothetical protein